MDVNQDILAFNPAPIVVAVVLLLACGLTYRRTRSWARTAQAAGLVAVGYLGLALLLHAVGFE